MLAVVTLARIEKQSSEVKGSQQGLQQIVGVEIDYKCEHRKLAIQFLLPFSHDHGKCFLHNSRLVVVGIGYDFIFLQYGFHCQNLEKVYGCVVGIHVADTIMQGMKSIFSSKLCMSGIFVRFMKMKLDKSCSILEMELRAMSMGLVHAKCNIYFPGLFHACVSCLLFVYVRVDCLNLNKNMNFSRKSS